MQLVIQVLCKGSKSLRDTIAGDGRLGDYCLRKVHSKRKHRSPGWAKVRSSDAKPGAINFVWSGSSQTLTCRVVTKRGNKPHDIVGDFIAYLFARHSSRVVTVVMSWKQ